VKQARLERYIRKLVADYQVRLGLDRMTIHLTFEPHEDRKEDGIAHTDGDPHYNEAWMSFDLDAIAAEANRRVEAGGVCCPLLYYERLVRHELAHAGTWRFYKVAEAVVGKRAALRKVLDDEFEALATWIELFPIWKHRCKKS
jgi:hypothetical protein